MLILLQKQLLEPLEMLILTSCPMPRVTVVTCPPFSWTTTYLFASATPVLSSHATRNIIHDFKLLSNAFYMLVQNVFGPLLNAINSSRFLFGVTFIGHHRRREAERTGRDIVNQANSAFNYMKLCLQIVYPTTRGCLGVEKHTWLLGFCFALVTFMIIVFSFHPQFEGLEEFAEVIDAVKENGVLVVGASLDDIAKANDERLGNFQVKQAL